jgi:hypothetical protein
LNEAAAQQVNLLSLLTGYFTRTAPSWSWCYGLAKMGKPVYILQPLNGVFFVLITQKLKLMLNCNLKLFKQQNRFLSNQKNTRSAIVLDTKSPVTSPLKTSHNFLTTCYGRTYP